MSNVMIIGAGGVGSVVAHKCAQVPEVFSEIVLASRTVSKCDAIAAQLPRPVITEAVDADNVPQTVALLRKHRPDLVINVALPYQDLHIMDACLEAGVNYLDTANYEPPDKAKFEYKWQWAYHDRFKQAGLMALLGSGFDPGVTSVFCTYAQKHFVPNIEEIDIIDCNAGDHGQPFATNFNPEINIREVTARGRFWKDGEWVETDPLSVKSPFTLPDDLGKLNIYLMYHEELESLAKHIPGLKRASFWMSFSDNYLKHLEVLGNVGMTRIDPVRYNGVDIIPLKFLKALLPDPASLGPLTKGKTCIGCQVKGLGSDGKPATVFIYNVCDHEACYAEVRSQAISYTTGVPAMIGAKMMLTGKWSGAGVFNMEQFDPDPFMDDLNRYGLPWQVLKQPVFQPPAMP
jgi:saccharopine dehydrogenase (NAD+, L-lysine-forming)